MRPGRRMDPTNSRSMSTFQLCEHSSCTDLPVLDCSLDLLEDCSSDASSDSDSGIVFNVAQDVQKRGKVLTPEMVNEGIKIMSYAVRGPLMLRANELEKEVAQVGWLSVVCSS